MHNKTILPRGAAATAVVGPPPPQLTGSTELLLMGNGGLQLARPMQMMLMTATTAEERGGSSDRIRTGITPPLNTRDISGKSRILYRTPESVTPHRASEMLRQNELPQLRRTTGKEAAITHHGQNSNHRK